MAGVYVISYETDASTYKAYLLAVDRADATGYIISNMGKEAGFRINSVEQREEIHAVTDRMREKIAIVKATTETVEKEILVCPWCEAKNYETLHALKMHIVKNHADTKKEKSK